MGRCGPHVRPLVVIPGWPRAPCGRHISSPRRVPLVTAAALNQRLPQRRGRTWCLRARSWWLRRWRRALAGRRLRPSAVRIANGTRVRLRGLVGAAELNGRRGVVKAFAASAGRYTIELLEEGAGASQGDGRRVKIKMMNMVQELMIRRLSDGTTGTIMGILNDGSTEAGVEYDLELTQTHARELTEKWRL